MKNFINSSGSQAFFEVFFRTAESCRAFCAGRIFKNLNLQNQRGFSLVEAVLGAVIVIVISLGFATVMIDAQRSQNSLKFRAEGDNFLEEARALLSSAEACKNTFIGPGLTADTGVAHLIPEVRNSSAPTGTTVYKIGDVLADQSITIESIRLDNFVAGATADKVEMTLNFNLASTKDAAGALLIGRSFRIAITRDPATKLITGCLALAKMSDGIWQRTYPNIDNIFFMGNSLGGNVGIGTNLPARPLTVKDGIYIYTDPGSGDSAPIELVGNGSHLYRIQADLVGFQVFDATTVATRFLISPAGNVGIGTANPTMQLTIASDQGNVFGVDKYGDVQVTGGTDDRWNIQKTNTSGTQTEVFAVEPNLNVTFPLTTNVGIGTKIPDAKLTVFNGATTGRYTTAGWTHTSDISQKNSILPLANSLENIKRLRGVTYKFNADPAGRDQIGFIAQEVEPVFPQVVSTDDSGMKSMVYANLIAPVIEAIKELAILFEGLRLENLELKTANLLLKKQISQLNDEHAKVTAWICIRDPKAAVCDSK